MSQDQRPGAIKMVNGQASGASDPIIVESGHPAKGKDGKGDRKGAGPLPFLLFAVGAAAAGAAIARLGVGT